MPQTEPQKQDDMITFKKPFWWRRDVRLAIGIVGALIFAFMLNTMFGGKEQAAKEATAALTEQYEQVEEGMTIAAVQEIMGPGEELSHTTILETETVILVWNDAYYNSATMTFINGKLANKILVN